MRAWHISWWPGTKGQKTLHYSPIRHAKYSFELHNYKLLPPYSYVLRILCSNSVPCVSVKITWCFLRDWDKLPRIPFHPPPDWFPTPRVDLQQQIGPSHSLTGTPPPPPPFSCHLRFLSLTFNSRRRRRKRFHWRRPRDHKGKWELYLGTKKAPLVTALFALWSVQKCI